MEIPLLKRAGRKVKNRTEQISHTLYIKNEYKPWLVTSILFFSDLVSILLSFYIAYALRKLLIPALGGEVSIKVLLPMLYMTLILVVGLFITNDLYPGIGRTGVVEFKEIIRIVSTSYIVLGLASFAFQLGNQFSRAVFAFSWLLSCGLISLFRITIHNRGSLLAWWGKPCAIVGERKDVATVIAKLIHSRRMAFKPVIALIIERGYKPVEINDVPTFPISESLIQTIKKSKIKYVIFANRSSELNRIQKQVFDLLSLNFQKMLFVVRESPISTLSVKILDLDGSSAFQMKYNLLDPLSLIFKRGSDLIVCILTLVFTFPIFLLLALLIYIDTHGPVLFIQKRMGKNGRIFNLYKFRTMEPGAEKKLETLLDNHPGLRKEYQRHHKIQKDPRITRIGRLLRKTSLDEFPQLWNVIRGDMSMIGPRAYLPNEKKQMGSSIDIIHRVSPGLTGWWQVMGRNELTFKERLKLDEFYISNFSLWMDLYIAIKTIWIMISGKGQ
jgi:Undecaprenyl-phosphate galactose phosphotransferase WbaP